LAITASVCMLTDIVEFAASLDFHGTFGACNCRSGISTSHQSGCSARLVVSHIQF
jgi:hypothetical protein